MTNPHSPNRTRAHSRRVRTGLVALLLVVAGCTGPAAIVDFYVDPASGNDANPGSAAEPYRTLTHALSVAAAGHTIHLAAGTYNAANGEVWPSFAGLPPVADANVPSGVTVTGDGNLVRLGGPAGADTETALVFDGSAEVIGVSIVGFEVGVLAVDGAVVVLDDVHVEGSGEIGVMARGDAELTMRDGSIFQSSSMGLAAIETAVVTIEGSEIYQNHPGVEVSNSAAVTITGSDLHDNGSGIPGGLNSAVSVTDDAIVSISDTALHDNAYTGIHLQGAFDVTVGPGTDIYGNYIGVVADAFLGGAASIAFDGAAVHDNEYEGIYWAVPLGASFTMRDTAVTNNGDNGLFFFGDASVIDLGRPGSPGGNDFSGNNEPLILDLRPARAAPDGTIITVSHSDAMPTCPAVVGPQVGPIDLDCDGVTVVGINNVNNRVEMVTD